MSVGYRLSRAAFVLGLERCAALALLAILRSTPAVPADGPPAADVAAIAARPASFRAAEVHVRGRIAGRPTRVSDADRGAFILDGGGAHLLVVAAKGHGLTWFRAGTDVIVRGTIVVPPDSKRLARRPTSRTAIAKRAHATALVKAVEVTLAR